MYPTQIEFLRHILSEAEFIIRHTDSLTYEKFISDEVLLKAIIRSVEVLGEAAKKVDPELKAQNSFIDWKGMAGMRDV